MIPKPMPMHLGIANLPVMLALDLLSPGSFCLLAAIKILGQALITGTLFSYVFLFSLAGTALSALAMYFFRSILGSRRISFIGIGVIGAMVSNSTQLALARFFIPRQSIRYIAPPFLFAGLITGIALGSFCELFCRRSTWYAAQKAAQGAVQ
jgi:heptaprenyl diphosphate synthase